MKWKETGDMWPELELENFRRSCHVCVLCFALLCHTRRTGNSRQELRVSARVSFLMPVDYQKLIFLHNPISMPSSRRWEL